MSKIRPIESEKSARGKGTSTRVSRTTVTAPPKPLEGQSEGEENEPPKKKQKRAEAQGETGEGSGGGGAGSSKGAGHSSGGAGSSSSGAGGSTAGVAGASTFHRYTLAEAKAKFRPRMHVYVKRGGSLPWVKGRVVEVYEDKQRKTLFLKYKCIEPDNEVLKDQILAEHPRNVVLAKDNKEIGGRGKKGKKAGKW